MNRLLLLRLNRCILSLYLLSGLCFADTINSNVKIHDSSGNGITSQSNGGQRALDVGIDVSGSQIDPRSTRALTSSDTVTVVQPTGSNLHVKIDSSVAPVNANADLSSRQSVTSSESNLSAPSNSIGVIVECESVNADNLRWGFSNSSSNILSSTLGVLCEPGRDSGFIPLGSGSILHMISTGSGSDFIDVQWVLSQ